LVSGKIKDGATVRIEEKDGVLVIK